MEPYSTLYQILTPCALGWSCCSRAGSRPSRSGRYGPFVGHKRSGGRFYPHMDLSPPWTRFWQPMTREGGAAGRQAAGPLGGVMGHAGLSVGHKCSRGRFYPHLEPFSTLYQNLTPRALGWGCCSRAGSRCSRRGLDVYGEQA